MLGAVAGAIGAVGGAWTTSRAQWKSARLAARAEHRRQRRDPRSQVYSEFLSVANQFTDAWVGVANMSAMTDEKRVEIRSAFLAFKNVGPAVALSGPEEVSVLAESIRNQAARLTEMSRALWAGHVVVKVEDAVVEPWILEIQSNFLNDLNEYASEVAKFTKVARATLDDDGSNL